MEKNKLSELANELGINKEAFEFSFKKDKPALEKQITNAAKFMGLK